MSIYQITCEICGTDVKKLNKQKTCSRKCRDVRKGQILRSQSIYGTCPMCLTEGSLPNSVHGVSVCSKYCRVTLFARYRYHRNTWPNGALEPIRKLKESEICKHCKKEFKPGTCRAVFCSSKCASSFYSQPGSKKWTRVRSRIVNQREQRDSQIKRCELCLTPNMSLLTAMEMGRKCKTGQSKFQRDHIVPRSYGGTDDESNIRDLCWFCNQARMDMDAKYDSAIAAAGKAFWNEINK